MRTVCLVVLFLIFVGCAQVAYRRDRNRWEQAFEQAPKVAIEECKAKQLSPLEEENCKMERMHEIMAASGYPHMELIDLLIAHWRNIYRNLADGKISPEEAAVQWAEIKLRLLREQQRLDEEDLRRAQKADGWLTGQP